MNRIVKISAMVIAVAMMSSSSCLADRKIVDHWVSPTPHRIEALVDVEADYISMQQAIVVTFYSIFSGVEIDIYQDGVLYDQENYLLVGDGTEVTFPVLDDGNYQVVVKVQDETIYSESFTVNN